jgi:hypothetical protein
MAQYEYKVVPSPRKGEKAREAKSVQDRFALALTLLMNRLGQEGWEYLRADALPCDERVGLTGTKTTFQSMLVFRRVLEAGAVQAPAVLTSADPVPVYTPVLGAAQAPAGAAPAIGPANPGLAAE